MTTTTCEMCEFAKQYRGVCGRHSTYSDYLKKVAK